MDRAAITPGVQRYTKGAQCTGNFVFTDRRVGTVNPSVPFWGGPVAVRRAGLEAGDDVVSYGASSLRGGTAATGPKRVVVVDRHPSGWAHDVYTATPGVPGDSASGFLDADGRAFGTLSTVALAPLAGSNGIGDLHHDLAFAQRYAGIPRLRLDAGAEPFVG